MDNRKTAFDMYRRGQSLRHVARTMGVSHQTVRNWLVAIDGGKCLHEQRLKPKLRCVVCGADVRRRNLACSVACRRKLRLRKEDTWSKAWLLRSAGLQWLQIAPLLGEVADHAGRHRLAQGTRRWALRTNHAWPAPVTRTLSQTLREIG